MKVTKNKYVNRAIEVLKQYHPEADDPLGGLQLTEWLRPFPKSEIEMQVYQNALLMIGAMMVRSEQPAWSERIYMDGGERSPIRIFIEEKSQTTG